MRYHQFPYALRRKPGTIMSIGCGRGIKEHQILCGNEKDGYYVIYPCSVGAVNQTTRESTTPLSRYDRNANGGRLTLHAIVGEVNNSEGSRTFGVLSRREGAHPQDQGVPLDVISNIACLFKVVSIGGKRIKPQDYARSPGQGLGQDQTPRRYYRKGDRIPGLDRSSSSRPSTSYDGM